MSAGKRAGFCMVMHKVPVYPEQAKQREACRNSGLDRLGSIHDEQLTGTAALPVLLYFSCQSGISVRF